MLILLALPAFGQVPVTVGPEPKTQFLDNAGAPLASGIVCTYQAGTSTPLATYTDSTGSVQNTNPVVLDAGGRANIWWQSAAYKVVLAGGGTCASPSNLMWTVDNFQVGVFLNGNNTWTGTNTFNGVTTFNAAANLTAGGSMNGTFSGNPNFSGSPTFAGTIVASQFQSTVSTGTPPLIVASTTNVPNLNVGNINGIAYPAVGPLHSVPVVTTANTTATYEAVPDCEGGVGALGFTAATNTFTCNTNVASPIDAVGQSAAIGTTTILTCPASPATGSAYLLSWRAKVTTIDGASSTLGPMSLTYTTPDSVLVSAANMQYVLGPAGLTVVRAGLTADNVNDLMEGISTLIFCKASTTIAYAMGYASNTPGKMIYDLHIRLLPQ